MKYCWHEQKNRLFTIFGLVLTLAIFVYVFFYILSNWPPILGIPLLLLATYYYLLFLLCVFVEERKYQVSAEGIQISYPFRITHKYSWDDFSEIALCKVRYNSKYPQMHSVAIRCVVGKEKRGPQDAKQANEKWSTELYEVKHWKSVVTIEFSDQRFKEFFSLCPCIISDYRHLEDPIV